MQDKAEFFVVYDGPALTNHEMIETQITTEKLQAVSLSFREQNKWRFTDGNSTFHAAMRDEKFLCDIEENKIQFCKDDVFTVQIRKQRWLDEENKMRSEYEILEVLAHQSAARQLRLPFED